MNQWKYDLLRWSVNWINVFNLLQLPKKTKGFGTDDTSLIRIIVLRSEYDLNSIKIEFEQKYKKSLESFIKVAIYFNFFQDVLSMVLFRGGALPWL